MAKWCVVVGFQKAGTASLHKDLQSCPGFFAPETKEFGWFNDDRINNRARRKRFDEAYATAPDDAIRVDVSTSYSQHETYPGVPSRLRSVCGDDVTLVASLRDPVQRLLSHHRHEASLGLLSADLEEALNADSRLISNGLYHQQLRPWVQEVGWNRIQIVDFAGYIGDRFSTMCRVARRCGAPVPKAPTGAMEEVHNETVGRLTPTGLIGRLILTETYVQAKQHIPKGLRDRVRNATATETTRLPEPDARLLSDLRREFSADCQLLASELNKLEIPAPEFLKHYLEQ